MERMKATELTKKLEAAKEPFSASVWYTAGYNSPYQLTNRHNEVWIPRATDSKAGGDSKSQTESAKKAEAGK